MSGLGEGDGVRERKGGGSEGVVCESADGEEMEELRPRTV